MKIGSSGPLCRRLGLLERGGSSSEGWFRPAWAVWTAAGSVETSEIPGPPVEDEADFKWVRSRAHQTSVWVNP